MITSESTTTMVNVTIVIHREKRFIYWPQSCPVYCLLSNSYLAFLSRFSVPLFQGGRPQALCLSKYGTCEEKKAGILLLSYSARFLFSDSLFLDLVKLPIVGLVEKKIHTHRSRVWLFLNYLTSPWMRGPFVGFLWDCPWKAPIVW